MQKYWQLLGMFITRYLSYRARVVIHAITDSTQYLLFPFLWMAIFANSRPPGGFTINSLVTYYIVMAIVTAGFTAHPSRHVRNELHDGSVNRFLISPLPFFNKMLMAEISYKCISSILAAITLITLFIFARESVVFPDSIVRWGLFLISLIFTFSISFLIEYILGLGSMWIGDIHSIQTWEEIMNAIFSGRLAPLAFLPLFLQHGAAYLPFQYIAFVPAQIFLGRISTTETWVAFSHALVWVAILGTIVYVMWRRGLYRYDGSSI